MKRLIMVRHGETKLNRQGVLQGQSDTALNDVGQQQAQLVAKVLRNEPFDAIWSSPLTRAVQTATPINEYHKKPIEVVNALLERSFGDYEGKPVNTLIEDEKGNNSDLFTRPMPNGESLEQLYVRSTLFANVIRQCSHDTLLIVGHAGMFRALIGALLSLEFEHWFNLPQHNTCLNSFIFDTEGIITAYQLNEHSHCH